MGSPVTIALMVSDAMVSGESSSEAFRSLPTSPITCRSSPVFEAGTEQIAHGR